MPLPDIANKNSNLNIKKPEGVNTPFAGNIIK